MSLLLTVLLAATAGAELQPVSPERLRGQRLHAPEWNLSIAAPDATWTWWAEPAAAGARSTHETFACRSPEGGEVRVIAFRHFQAELTKEDARQFAEGVASSFQRHGWQTTVRDPEPSSVPLADSFRYAIDVTGANGVGHVYGYLAVRGRQFAFQQVSADPSEPALFRDFVRSFAFEGTPQRDPIKIVGNVSMVLASAVTLLLGGLGWGINKAAGRIVVNLWNVAIVLLLLAGAGLAVVWLSRLPASMTAHRQGYIVGYTVAGPIVYPLAFAVWRAIVVRRRRRDEQASAGASK